jgi:Transposase, Mutator family
MGAFARELVILARRSRTLPLPAFRQPLPLELALTAARQRLDIENTSAHNDSRWAGEVRGYREILGICEGAKEDKAGWSGFLKHLKERGLRGVQLIISDACMGLSESAAEYFPDAAWQRCIVHWY